MSPAAAAAARRADPAVAALCARLSPAVDRILEIQEPDGAIPWFEDGPWDPWNHVEAAMALSVMGHGAAADAAYACLQERQDADGSWLGEYGSALPMSDRLHIARQPAPAFKDANFIAYPTVGVWHRLVIDGDLAAARAAWPMVDAALRFVLTLQGPEGDVSWCAEAQGSDVDDALLAGNACIAKSLECGIALGRAVDAPVAEFVAARRRLLAAMRARPERFDRRGAGARYAMDWYYPALCGVLTPAEGRERLRAGWAGFVLADRGSRCVADEPWATVAESAELALALAAVEEPALAREVFEAQFKTVDALGRFWMGWQSEEEIFWPQEQPAWTQGAMILAADALFELSPASTVLVRPVPEAA
ncbi:MAG: prenyltransferase [Pseudomonadota bacterium]